MRTAGLNARRLLFRLVVFAPFALLSNQLSAQSNADSLQSILHSGKADGSTYNALIWVYVFNQPDSAIHFGNKALKWCAKSGQDSLVPGIYNRLGVAYDIKSMPDSALHWYGLALRESRLKKNLKTEAGALNNIGLIHWNKGAIEKAIDHYVQSAKIFEKIGDEMGLGNNYNNIGLILNEDHQYDKSLRYHRQALQIRLKINQTYGIAASYTNMAQVFLFRDNPDLDSAEHYLHLAIPLKLKLNDSYGLARSYSCMANVHLARKQFDQALTYSLKTLHIQKAIGNSEGYASTYYNIAEIFQDLNDRATMLMYLDSAQLVAEAHHDMALLWKIYWSKAKTLSKLGRFEDAYPYWISYANLKDSLINAERSHYVEELETQYRTAQQEAEIADKRAALAGAKLKIENRTKWLIAMISGLIMVMLLGFGLFQRNKRKSQAEKDAAIIQERERGIAAVIDATEEERKRIAKDLHDGIVQSLTGLSLRLQKGFSMLKDVSDEQRSRYAESKAILDDSINEVRNISHRMMPRALGELGLVPAIDDMLGKSLGMSDIKYEFEHHKVDGQRFDEKVEVSLYRICQELINNIIKHSGALAVSVQLIRTNSHLVLVVEDNGKGFTFDPKNEQNGIGLMNISSRTKAMNGEMNYQPSPNQGTVATIRIPI